MKSSLINKNNQQPLTPHEYDQLFQGLELMCQRIERLLSQGMLVAESSLDDERVSDSRGKIDDYREKIRREQDLIQRLKVQLRHKAEMNKK